ncbi:cobyrinate a,c-diamide synthase [Streptomyces sp. ZAF1911]|uniref:cobyrinate a,c-diamide synthase n=1 Tax=Streptomyces sp. ZAF1911 TaxID=2944129 RepID=UPI00237BB0F8|nr:cobyrinate a,c-diamide synthase [Streptomyces sp. ZAF1911]MDD9381987.1 cobyrinate a,c-diamide synthase [Streptomyces sp. ZAF1911]
MVTSFNVPRLVIAAPSSGSGKTTVATGLMAAFSERGLAVSPHKAGPDYIDPGYHALATGRPGRNLDAFMCGPELVAPLFAHGAAGCDLAVIEGVMGLYDGAAGRGELASTAQVAKLLRAPVVLVVDASSQSRSVAALVHGFASFDPQVRLGGVILNKVGSDRHEVMLREALEEAGMPVLGVLRRAPQVAAPSRHLGLVPVAERRRDALDSVTALAEQVRQGCDLDALMALARTAPPLACEAWSPEQALLPHPAPSRNWGSAPDPAPQTPARLDLSARPAFEDRARAEPARGEAAIRHSGKGRGGGPVVAVAGGAAFTFSYAEHAELLTAAGAEVVTFDPLRDERLPDHTTGLVIGGGFPEVYAPELSANEPLRKAVAAFAAAGGPVAAECAGLLYLARSLDGKPMCGVLDADARMSERLTLGYREAVAVSDSVLAPAGTRLRGHEFHRTVIEPGAGAAPAWGFTHPERRVEGFVAGGVHASYLHTHWAAEPSVALRFAEAAAAHR